MTDEERDYLKAKQRFEAFHIDPAQGLLEATNTLVEKHKAEATTARDILEQMRPVWAQGWTTDGVAAQVSSNALAELWKLLRVTNQTAAVEHLKALLGHWEYSSENPLPLIPGYGT